MLRLSLKLVILILCMAVLVVGVVHQAGAQAAEIQKKPAVLEAAPAAQAAQPAIWYGLAASLTGTVVFWSTVLIMAKRRGY